MGPGAVYTLALTVVAVALLVSGRLRVDLVALLVLAGVVLGGVLPPAAALAGFGHPATLTVAAMFVLSAGLLRTGGDRVAERLLEQVMRGGRSRGTGAMMGVVAGMSAFVSNTAVVAVLLPVVLQVGRRIGVSPSRLLMPLSYAAMLGGACTLIGTSTNLLASEILRAHGQAPFGMFELAPVGLLLLAGGVAYMLLFGLRRVPPRRPPDELTQAFEIADYLTEVRVVTGGGLPLRRLPVVRDLELDVIEVRRGDERLALPGPEQEVRPGDVLRVRSSREGLRRLSGRSDVVLEPALRWRDADLEAGDLQLLEAVVPPSSGLAGESLETAAFRSRFGATVLAIRSRGEILHDQLKRVRLAAGDTLLLEVRRSRLERLRVGGDLVLLGGERLPVHRRRRLALAAGIMVGVVAAASSGLVPIVVAALCGTLAMVLTRCLTLEEAYAAVDWQVVVVLAGMLSLGHALEATGGALVLARGLLAVAGVLGPVALVSAFYLLTSLLTEVMSNNATVALLTPVAIATGAGLGLDPRALVVAVALAASASFMTPIGYQTNTLIYGPGGYRFTDFVRVGAPLNLLCWAIASLAIPWVFPLAGGGAG